MIRYSEIPRSGIPLYVDLDYVEDPHTRIINKFQGAQGYWMDHVNRLSNVVSRWDPKYKISGPTLGMVQNILRLEKLFDEVEKGLDEGEFGVFDEREGKKRDEDELDKCAVLFGWENDEYHRIIKAAKDGYVTEGHVKPPTKYGGLKKFAHEVYGDPHRWKSLNEMFLDRALNYTGSRRLIDKYDGNIPKVKIDDTRAFLIDRREEIFNNLANISLQVLGGWYVEPEEQETETENPEESAQ